jgi:hypothetical protein
VTLEIPQRVVLVDGKTADVKGVAARVIDGRLDEVVYTVEKRSGAWESVRAVDVHPSVETAAMAIRLETVKGTQ